MCINICAYILNMVIMYYKVRALHIHRCHEISDSIIDHALVSIWSASYSLEKNSGSSSFLIRICFLFWFGYGFPIYLRRCWFGYWSLRWISIILGAYINSLGVAFWRCVKNSREFQIFTIESYERDLLVTHVFSSLFSIKISPLLPVDVGTLSNHVKSSILWLFGDLVSISY